MTSGQRRGRWTGLSLSERQARRRAELITAGIDLLGSPDGPALTVRAVCRRAELTERYFYECFADRDEFVRAVYDEVGGAAMTALSSAHTPREAVEGFVALMVDAPARGRVLLLAPSVEPALARPGAAWMPSFIELLQHRLTAIDDPATQRMTAISLVAGLTGLFTAYLDGGLTVDRKKFVDYCVALVARHTEADNG